MMRRFATSLAVSATLSLLWAPVCLAQSVAVSYFGNNRYQPHNVEWAQQQPGINLLIINLDEHRNLEKELALDLPLNDPDRAVAIARQRVDAVPSLSGTACSSGR